MRASTLFVGFVTVGLLACSNNTHHVIIDANTIDSPPDAFVCDFDAMNTGTLSLDAGPPDHGPIAFMGTYTKDTPPLLAFALNGILSNTAPQKDLFMIWIDTKGMFAAAGTEGVFTGPPKVASQNIDIDTACGGCLDGFTGYTNGANGNPDVTTATQVYQIDATAPGTLQFDIWSGKVVVNTAINVKGSYNNVSFIGFDPVSQMPNGCLSVFAKLQFNFTLTWPPPAFASGERKYVRAGDHEVDVTDIQTAVFH